MNWPSARPPGWQEERPLKFFKYMAKDKPEGPLSKESRIFLSRWAEDVRAEFRRACARESIFTHMDFTCNRSGVGVSSLRHEVALVPKEAA